VAEFDPSFAEIVLLYKVGHLAQHGRLDDARAAFQPFEGPWTAEGAKLEERLTWLPTVVSSVLGRREEAERSLSRLTEVAKAHHVPARGFAYAYAALGDAERFFEWLGRSVDDHTIEPIFRRMYPVFRAYGNDPRMREIYRRCGVP
jgi:hypothetical protein